MNGMPFYATFTRATGEVPVQPIAPHASQCGVIVGSGDLPLLVVWIAKPSGFGETARPCEYRDGQHEYPWCSVSLNPKS